jgi:hypothetical protein
VSAPIAPIVVPTLRRTKPSTFCRALDTAERALDREQREILTLYTAMYCVDFLSGLGQRFNQDEAPSIDPQQLRRLTTILDGLLHAIDEKRSTN